MIENQATHWAVVDENFDPICAYSTILSVDTESSAKISVSPIENGELAAFNHVTDPDKVTVTIGFDGDYDNQDRALVRLQSAVKSTERFTIFTPSRIWRRMGLENVNYTRSATSGAHYLECELEFVEVLSVDLQSRNVAYSPKRATSARKVQTGKTQAKTTSDKDLESWAHELAHFGEGGKR